MASEQRMTEAIMIVVVIAVREGETPANTTKAAPAMPKADGPV